MIVDIYNISNIIINKDHSGWFAPTRFNLLIKNAQMRCYDELTDDYRRAKNRVLRHSPEKSLAKINQALSTIYTLGDLTKSSGKFALPSDSMYLESVFVDDVLINEVTISELKKISRSSLTTPSESEAVYVNYGEDIEVYPDTIGEIEDIAFSEVSCAYYKVPDDPQIAFIEVDGVEIINPSATTDITLPESFFDKLVVYVCEQMGVSIRESDVYQYAQNEETKELQKTNT